MATAFFKLTKAFAIEETEGLSGAEIRILLLIKTLNPFGDRTLNLSSEEIARQLKIDRSTVSRGLKKLKELGKITVEIVRKIIIKDSVSDDNQNAVSYEFRLISQK